MEPKKTMVISSPAFKHGGSIPAEFTCDGEDKNPPLAFEGVPDGTKSLVLIMDDPDAPGGTFDHWVVWNIRPQEAIAEDSTPGQTGRNSLGQNRYTGPCPPSGQHRYFFKVYALDCVLELKAASDKQAVGKAMEGHILGYGELLGYYKRPRS